MSNMDFQMVLADKWRQFPLHTRRRCFKALVVDQIENASNTRTAVQNAMNIMVAGDMRVLQFVDHKQIQRKMCRVLQLTDDILTVDDLIVEFAGKYMFNDDAFELTFVENQPDPEIEDAENNHGQN